MLDTSIILFSIDAKVATREENISKALVIRGCKIYVADDERIYSELEEQTFNVLNQNIGYGILDIEFVFVNNILKESYPEFYTKCFVIRTDNEVRIKPMKVTNIPSNSKINQNGELVIGVRYYFRDKKEIEGIMKAESILIEGFVALGKPKNVFGVMCQLNKVEDKWEISAAYTYKPRYAKNIKYLID